MSADLAAAIDLMYSQDQLCIVSAGLKDFEGFQENLVPCDSRLRQVVDGAMQSLNVRVARKIVTEASRWPIRASVLQKRYESLLCRLPELKKHERKIMTDTQILAFIRDAKVRTPKIARTPLLRELRSLGYACEQSRFAKLFRQGQENA